MAARRRGTVQDGRGRPVGAPSGKFRDRGYSEVCIRRAAEMKRAATIAWSTAVFCTVLHPQVAAQSPSVEAAWKLIAAGNRTQAIVLLRDILKDDSKNVDARLLLGSILMEQGDR